MAESLTTPAILPQTIAENGDATVIPATNDQTEGKASIAYGFPPLTSTPIADGGKMVRRADFNGLFNLLSQYALFTQNGGLFTFNQSVSDAIGGYPLGATLVYTDSDGKSHIVKSLIPNNTYNFVSDPTYIDGLKWDYDFLYVPSPINTSKDNRIATTEWISDLLKGEMSGNNGWIYLGNNLALQFGRANAVSPDSNVTLTTSFDNNNYRVVAAIGSTANINYANYVVNTDNYTTTTFRVRLSGGTPNISYIAIGKKTVANKP